MSKHTSEPWIVEKAHDIDAIAWVGQFAVLPQDHATKVVRGNTEEDARRIVACVNACAGVDTDLLEAGELDKPTMLVIQENKDLKHRCDELLAALEDAVETIEWMNGCSSPARDEVDAAIKEGRAVIAKAKGNTAA